MILTTNSYPTIALHKFASLSNGWKVLALGNKQTPIDWEEWLPKPLKRTVFFLSLEKQQALGYHSLAYITEETYKRNNVGYLLAIKCGAKVIYETAENIMLDIDQISMYPSRVCPEEVPTVIFHMDSSHLVNVYGRFLPTVGEVWPHGLGPEERQKIQEGGWISERRHTGSSKALIQQFLVDFDKEVEGPSLTTFNRSVRAALIDKGTYTPYNSKNTVTHYEAFWSLYLPATTDMRMGDMLRAYFAQRLLWEIGGRLVFGGPIALKYFELNETLSQSFGDENLQNFNTSKLVKLLQGWQPSGKPLYGSMLEVASAMKEAGFLHDPQVAGLVAWIKDLQIVGYEPPSMKQSGFQIDSTQQQQTSISGGAAVCVTGMTERPQGWERTLKALKGMGFSPDIFLFLGISRKDHEGRKTWEGYFPNKLAMKVIYRDRKLQPFTPQEEDKRRHSMRVGSGTQRVYQQLWAEARCYELVEQYQNLTGRKYEYLIRARSDTALSRYPQHNMSWINGTVVTPLENNCGGFNDRFAFGPIKYMSRYMLRWYDFLESTQDTNLHAESFLKVVLTKYNVSVKESEEISYSELVEN